MLFLCDTDVISTASAAVLQFTVFKTSWSATADSECASNIAIVWQTVWKQACNCGTCVRPQVCKARAIWRMKCTVTELGGLGATYAVHLRLIGKIEGDILLVIIELFSLGAFVLSQYTRLTDRISTARWDLTKLDAHKKRKWNQASSKKSKIY